MMLSSKLRKWADPASGQEGLIYWCQGCESTHMIRTKGGPSAWGWNGDVEKPVFTPSVLSTSGHYVSGQPQPPDCFVCNENAAHPHEDQGGYKCVRCHTFVGCNGAQPGEVIFLSDCTHALAGQVHPLPDLPEQMRV